MPCRQVKKRHFSPYQFMQFMMQTTEEWWNQIHHLDSFRICWASIFPSSFHGETKPVSVLPRICMEGSFGDSLGIAKNIVQLPAALCCTKAATNWFSSSWVRTWNTLETVPTSDSMPICPSLPISTHLPCASADFTESRLTSQPDKAAKLEPKYAKMIRTSEVLDPWVSLAKNPSPKPRSKSWRRQHRRPSDQGLQLAVSILFAILERTPASFVLRQS